MSEEIKTPTPEEIKAQKERVAAEAAAAQEKVNARIAVLKGFEGKSFKDNSGIKTISKVLKYAGIIKNRDGNLAHAFEIVTQNPTNRFVAPASEFLDSHTVIELETATVQEVI